MNEFTSLIDLASERLGGKVIAANDEFFAPKENLLKAAKPAFIDGKYTRRGKWMDGWETRRRRTPGYDWCIIRLGLPGKICGIVVDTSFFRGNYPERFSLEGCNLGSARHHKEAMLLKSSTWNWLEVIPQTELKGDSQNLFSIDKTARLTHVRLKIYPDGGVARLRIHGEVAPDRKRIYGKLIDLAAVENGGKIIASSDRFFGEPLNLLLPGRGRNMADGWETRRRRGPGHDWVIVKLGLPGTVKKIEIDTAHFKGNFPESCSVESLYAPASAEEASAGDSSEWKEMMPRMTLAANRRHILSAQLKPLGAVTHVRFNIYPDGGVGRLRVFGQPERMEQATGIDRLNHLSLREAQLAFQDCCGSKSWSKQMAARLPFRDSEELMEAAGAIWAQLTRKDWLEAFERHPPIGKKKARRKQTGVARQWSSSEQAAAQDASMETRAQLTAANQQYYEKFGYVFLICATGKTSGQILASLRQRLDNDSKTELHLAGKEQQKITRLRLERLLSS